MTNSAVIIGSGNVAEAFARALPACGIEVRQIFARNAGRGEAVAALAGCGWTDDPAHLAAADIYITAVSDSSIGSVLDPLAVPATAVVVHTAGAQPVEAIPAHFARRGVLYPLQTFTAGRKVDFGAIPFFIEASDPATLAAIREVASRLSCHVFDSTSESRAEVHLAGVFACNFVNALYGIGQEMMARAGAPFEALVPLIVETARKAADSGDPAAVQTGPARRHDTTTMQRHMALLDGNGRLKNIYELMSQEIWEKTSRRN